MYNNLRVVEINPDKVKTKYFQKILSKVISEQAGVESRICEGILDHLGVTFESQKETIGKYAPIHLRAGLEALMMNIENSVDNFYIRHNGVFEIQQGKEAIAVEAETEEAMVEDDMTDGDLSIASMLEDLADRHASEVKDFAKYVLQLEKKNQDAAKASILADNDDVVELNKDDEDEKGDGPFSSEEDEKDSEKDGDKSGEGDNSDGEGNPFADDGSGDADNDNPFAEGSDSEKKTEGDSKDKEETSEGSDSENSNPFESVNSLSGFKLPSNGKSPLLGLENGDLVNFTTTVNAAIFAPLMKEAFESHGVESTEYKAIATKFAQANRMSIEAIVATLGACAQYGITYEIDKLKYPELYIESMK